jgi:peptidoglycan/xylan/chitin deacetylase (PgdA/CDA1 family)
MIAASTGASASPLAQTPNATTAVAANQAPTSSVALAADPSGFDFAFYRGQDGAVYQRTLRLGVWSAQTAIGGAIVGAPAAALARTTLVLAVRGTDNVLWLKMATHGVWGGWQSLGGVLSAAPAVIGDAAGRIDVYVRGADNVLWTRTLPFGGSWTPWKSLGGTLASGPGAASAGTSAAEVYVAGADHAVWRKTLSAGAWSGWVSLGGRTYTAPAAVRTGTGSWVFIRGLGNHLYLRHGSPSWVSLGGVLVDAPATTGISGGWVDVVVRGTDAALWSRHYQAGSWSGWAKAWTPAAPPAPPAGRLGTDWTRIPTSAKVVALTFDAGANAAGLASIRATLQRTNVPATFFLTGQFVRSFPAQANEVAIAGFRLGNHSDTHPDFTTLTDTQVRSQVLTAERAVLLADGGTVRPLFRFPFGAVNSRVLADVNGLGYVSVRWTVDSLGWEGTSGGQSVASVTARVLAAAQPGEIVLMHVGSNPTDGTTLDAAALPQIISGLKARGYRFVTLDALLG